MNKIELQKTFDQLNSFTALETATCKPVDQDRLVMDAAIQRFEFVIELLEVLKDFKNQGIEVQFPKNVLKEAFIGRLMM
jgi:hypothetical protein